jgi:hypothetical protein
MKALGTLFLLLCLTTKGGAQTLDQTFERLGSELEAAQQSLVGQSSLTGKTSGRTPQAGTFVEIKPDAPVYTRPEAGAFVPMRFEAKTPVVFQGVENGFAKIITPGFEGYQYVPLTALQSSSAQQPTGFVDGAIKTAIERLNSLVKELEKNPYVRVKGFTVDVAIPPSVKIEFEMRAASGPPERRLETERGMVPVPMPGR